MPPKKPVAEPPPPPPPAVEEPVGPSEAELASTALMDELIDAALREAQLRWVRAQVPAFVARHVLDQLQRALALTAVRADNGEHESELSGAATRAAAAAGAAAASSSSLSWAAAAHAVAPVVPVDTWARAVAPVVPLGEVSRVQSAGPSRDLHTRGSMRSGLSGFQQQQQQQQQRARGGVAAPGAASAAAAAAPPKPEPIARRREPDKAADPLRAQWERKRREMAAAQAMNSTVSGGEDAAAAEAARIAALKKEFKGRDWTYDADGKPIPLVGVQPQKLPASAVDPQVGLRSPQGAQGGAGARGKARAGDGRRASRALDATGSPSAAAAASSGADKQVEAPPAVIDAIQVKSGVVIRDGGRVKQGNAKPLTQATMGRTSFQQSLHALAGAGATSTMRGVAAAASSQQQQQQQQQMQQSQYMAADNEDLDESVYESIAEAPPAMPKDWGRNPDASHATLSQTSAPRMDRSLRERERARAVGQRTLEPKQRRFQAAAPTAEMKHLPPPLFPATHGHGAVKGQLGQTNPYAAIATRQRSPRNRNPSIATSQLESSVQVHSTMLDM